MPSCDIRVNRALCDALAIWDNDLAALAQELTAIISDELSTSTVRLPPDEVSIVKNDILAGQGKDHLWLIIRTGDNPERLQNLDQRREQIEERILKTVRLHSGTRFLVWIRAGTKQSWSPEARTFP